MQLDSGRFARIKGFFQNHGKGFWIPILILAIAGFGFGTWMVVRASTTGTRVKIEDTTSYRGSGYAPYTWVSGEKVYTYPIYYGVNEGSPQYPHTTYWYKVTELDGSNVNATHDAMCLQARRTSPDGEGTVVVNNTDIKKIMIATVPSYSSSSSGAPVNYYNDFSNYLVSQGTSWNTLTGQITNLRTRDTDQLEYSSNHTYANMVNGSEKARYANYYWGSTCNNMWSDSCQAIINSSDGGLSQSQVDIRDAVFAVGHILASNTYDNDGYYRVSDSAATLNTIKDYIDAFFSQAAYSSVPDAYTAYASWVNANDQTVGWLEYQGIPTYRFRIRKVSSASTSTGLANAAFRVCEVDGSDNDVNCQGPFSTNSNGYTQYVTVGSTKVRWYETTYPSGYTCQSPLNNQGTYGYCYAIENISDGDTVVVENTPVPTAYIKIKKVNTENSGVSYAGLTVVGTVFSVKSGSTEVATITIGSDGTGTTNVSLPVGTYTISEKTATTGYNVNSATLTVVLNSGNTATNPATVDMTTNSTACSSGSSPCWFKNEPIKGKVSFSKAGYELGTNNQASSRNLAGISFTAVNKADSSITYTIGPTASDGSVTSPSMVYGNYTATEIRSTTNAAYDLLSFDFSVTNTSTSSLGTKTDNIPDNPGLTTVARNANSTHENPDKEIEISATAGVADRITCSGLEAGKQYKLSGTLHDLDSGTEISSATVTFTAAANGTCPTFDGLSTPDMPFTNINTSPYIGKKLSIKQVLYKNNGTANDWVRIFIHNANLADTNQQVTVRTIEVHTTANSQRSSNNKELAAGIVTVVDTVQITGLTNGVTYKIRGVLKDASGNTIPLTNGDADDNTRKTENYTMASATGTTVNVSMELQFNSTAYVGGKVVVYEYVLSDAGTELAKHESLTDQNQTVTVLTPTIATIAVNNRGGDTPKLLEVGTQKVKDTISYTGLVANNTYRLEGQLVRTDTGDVVATKNQDFVATGETGTTDVVFDITTAELVGKNIVVYERLYYGNNKIAEHVVSTDEGQTVTVKTPTVGTTAVDNADGDKFVEVDEGIKLTDTVTYDGLVQGDTYTLVMKVLKRSAPDPNNPIATGTTEFQATGISGTTTVTSAAFDSTTLHDSNLVGLDLVVYEYLYYGSTLIGSHEEKDDTAQIVTVKTPTIHTSAADHKNGTQKLGVGRTTITDTVTYTDLVPGRAYVLSGTLMDKATGEPARDYNGNPITATANFTPTTANGTTTLTFNIFDTTLLYDYSAASQKEFVVFEKLYKTSIEIAHHEDLTDTAQTVQIATPEIRTTATYKADGGNLLGVGDVVMEDIVEYSGLVEGDYYTIRGYIIDPETNDIVNVGNTYFEGYQTFRAGTNGAGRVSLEISINTVTLQGRKFVVYEELYRSPRDNQNDDRLLAEHKEALDEGSQTIGVKIAKIETTATDKADGDKVLAHENSQTIHDVVAYDGLLMGGEEYILYGFLWDKTNNQPLLKDGQRITATATFTTPARRDSGTVEMDFPVDAYNLPGVEIVVYEYLFQGTTIPTNADGTPDTDQVIAKHEDPESVSQSVRVSMRVGTEAVDAYDNDHLIGVGNATIIDHLAYEGAKMGHTYKAKGWLVYKDTGEAVAGVSAKERTFVVGTTEDEETFDTDGSVMLTFEIDTRELIGKQLVVYEELYHVDDEGAEELVAEHKDLTDEGQTVAIVTPSLHTTATDKADGDKELLNDADVIILDKVEYSGLVKGTTYTLRGQLVDKSTGNRISGGITEVTLTFTTTADAGYEEMDFAINTSGLSGKELVVFETLYIAPEEVPDESSEDEPSESDEEGEEEAEPEVDFGYQIAEHKDLNDANQTIRVKLDRPNTGLFTRSPEGAAQAGIAVGATVIIVGISIVLRARKKKLRGTISFE